MANESSFNEEVLCTNIEVPIPRIVRFWLLTILDIPATLCSAFLLYHLLFKRKLRAAINNHIIIVFLLDTFLTQLIDIPSYIAFVHLGYVWWPTPGFCYLWLFIDVGLYNALGIFMLYGSFERHILIFHSNLVSTRKKRWIFHYIPFFLVIIYGLGFYVYAIFFPPCETIFDYTQVWCAYACYMSDPIVGLYDIIVNAIIPVLFNTILDIGLILRYVRQKRRIQVLQIRKYRRMIIQILSMSTLQLVLSLPILILVIAYLCGLPADIGVDVELYLYFFAYLINLTLPYVCLASFPELWKKIYNHSKAWLSFRLLHKQNIVAAR